MPSHKAYFPILITLSATIALAVMFWSPVLYLGGSSGTYLSYAQTLANAEVNTRFFWRTPGYPFFLILTGSTSKESLSGILWLQTALAFLMPLLIYQALHYFSKPLAMTLAIIVILSLTPYIQQKIIYPDHFHTFLPLLIAFFAARYCIRPRFLWLVACYLSVAVLSFFRPTMILLVPLLLWLLLIPVPSKQRHAMAHVILIVTLFAAHMSYTSFRNSFHREEQPVSFAGSQFFLNLYLYSPANGASFQSSNGPATKLFREKLISLFQDREAGRKLLFSKLSEETYETLYGQYYQTPEALVERLLTNPNKYYFWTLFACVNMLGQQGDQLITNVVWEEVQTHPSVLLKIMRHNGYAYFWGPGFRWKRDMDNLTNPSTELIYGLIPRDDALADEVKPTTDIKRFSKLNDAALSLFLGFMRFFVIANIVSIIAIPVIFYRRWRKNMPLEPFRIAVILFAMLITSFVLQAFPLAFIAEPMLRYQASTFPSLVISGGLGLWIVYRMMRHSSQTQH